MKRTLSLLTALLSLCFAQAQTIVTIGNITGSVADQQKPVESAAIALLRPADSVVIKKTLSDSQGKFSLQQNEPGDYIVSVQFVGYAAYYSERFTISDASTLYQVKPIVLTSLNKQLGNVVVTSKRPFIEQKLDRTLINVEASPTNIGLSALEVLEKSPGISC